MRGPRGRTFFAPSRSSRSGTGASPLSSIKHVGAPWEFGLAEVHQVLLRNDLRDGKPAYVVFDNKTLAAIARTAPTTLRDLGRISGVGPAKLERYGNAVIELIADLSTG